jgi:hypothetical protein
MTPDSLRDFGVFVFFAVREAMCRTLRQLYDDRPKGGTLSTQRDRLGDGIFAHSVLAHPRWLADSSPTPLGYFARAARKLIP